MTGDPYVIVTTGSRRFTFQPAIRSLLVDVIRNRPTGSPTGAPVIVHGACPDGADTLVDAWARRQGIRVDPMPADWQAPCRDTCRQGHRRRRKDGVDYCPAAGVYRNQDMIDVPPCIVVGFLCGPSNGTRDCLRRAVEAKIPVKVWRQW